MSPATEEVLASALRLPEPDQLAVAEALLAGCGPPPPEPSGDAWVAELNRRSDEIDAGTATLTPWAEVRRRVMERAAGRAVDG